MTLTDGQRALLNQITASDTFSRDRIDPINGKLLHYLAEHSTEEQRHLRTEEALLKAKIFEHHPPVAKMATFLSRLQRHIDKYFDEEAREKRRDHPQRILIRRGIGVSPKDPLLNAVLFVPNQVAEPLTRLFWNSHLSERATQIAYGLPLFTRDDQQEVFTRRIDVNTPAERTDPNKLPLPKAHEKVCWPFVTLGDVICVMKLTKWLTDHWVRVGSHGYKAESTHRDLLQQCETEEDNIIVLGSMRVNGILAEYQRRSALPYRLDIRAVHHVPDGKPYAEERSEFQSIVPVVVSRMPGQIGGVVTMIAANHGRAVSYVGKVLRREELLQKLFADPRLNAWVTEGLPTKFQIVLNIPVQDDEMLAGPAEVTEVWPLVPEQ